MSLFNNLDEIEFGDTDDVISAEALFQRDWKSVSDVIPRHFFERVVGLLPMHVPRMTNQDLISTLEVLVQREMGGERLFNHYIYMKIERNVLKFNTEQYCRTVRALADRQFVEDSVFWDDYVLKYVSHDKSGQEGARVFTYRQAKRVWDSLVYLQIRCPTIELKNALKHVEKWLD